jgi:alcohol dehydrogenase
MIFRRLGVDRILRTSLRVEDMEVPSQDVVTRDNVTVKGMPVTQTEQQSTQSSAPAAMKALVFRGVGQFGLEEKPIPKAGYGEAVVKTRLTTICGTDIHIVSGKYPVKPGLTIGHEAVGVVHELGLGVSGYKIGQRVLVGAITPCGQCDACLSGHLAQCGGAIGGWRFGNKIDGVQAEYFRVLFAQANLAAIPNSLADEDVLLLTDTASTGFAAVENARIRLGDSVAVFAQGPIGLCAILGARLMGAADIYAVDTNRHRLEFAQQFGATVTLVASEDPVRNIMELTAGRGVDVAIEALGAQSTFENALCVLAPGGRLSSVGVYSGHLSIPSDGFHAGLADQSIITTLCPGGKERMKRLMRLVQTQRIDLRSLLTHTFDFADITKAYKLFGSREDGVLKVAIRVC